MTDMPIEITMLAWAGLLAVVQVLIPVLFATPAWGLNYLAGPRDEGRKLDGVGGRAARADVNMITAIALFAPAALAVTLTQQASPTTALAAQTFFWARLVYLPIYMAGVPWLRTLVWLVGLAATVALYIALL